jgi:hypothetical protein
MAQRYSKDADVRERLVIARIGWCTTYSGDPEDPPRNGGSYNDTRVGLEHQNFRLYGDTYYGYARMNGSLALSRVTGRDAFESNEEEVDDVCVAVIAKSPEGGQVLVGWYRHSKLYAEQQKHAKRGGYQWLSRTAILLNPEERKVAIPKGKGATGQANFTYTRAKGGELLTVPYLTAIRRAILDWKESDTPRIDVVSNEDAIVRGQGFQSDVRYRTEIEAHSMRVVKRELRKRYANVHDVSAERSYDYLCISKNGRQRKVEVKGTTTAGSSVLVSRREFELAKAEPVDLYILSDIKIVDQRGDVSATGGTLTLFNNWSALALDSKAVGYEITLREKTT